MARVVQRRGTPPYLTIFFVGLFLVAAALAAIFYIQGQDLIKKADTADKAKVDADKLRDAAEKKSKAIGDANATKVQEAEALNTKIVDLNKQIADLQGSEKKLSTDLADKDKAVKDLQAKFEGTVTGLQTDLKAAQDKAGADLATKDEQLARATKEGSDKLQKLTDEKAALVADAEAKDALLRQRDTLITDLNSRIKELRGNVGSGDIALRHPDGKIVQLANQGKVVYINLGEKDGVTAGLPFSVYPRGEGIPATGEGKAKIIVVSVNASTSECNVLQVKKDDPIIEGDLIANAVFNQSRPYNFVVEGDFDLYGEGKTDSQANKRVKAMIDNFGGKISDTVNVNTDFVVMGEEPTKPPAPAADAPPAAWTIYQDKMKSYEQYKQVKAMAVSLQIPILNTTRFLAFTGVVAKK
jgi:NAD-dependent DNA ligase